MGAMILSAVYFRLFSSLPSFSFQKFMNFFLQVSFKTYQNTVVQEQSHENFPIEDKHHVLSVFQRMKENPQMSGVLLPNAYYEREGKMYVLYDSIFSSSVEFVDRRPYCNVSAYKAYMAKKGTPIPPKTLLQILQSAVEGYRNLFQVFAKDRFDGCPLNILISLDLWFLKISGRTLSIQVAGVQTCPTDAMPRSEPPGKRVIQKFGEVALELLDLERDEVVGAGRPESNENESILNVCRTLLASCFEDNVHLFGHELISKFFYDFEVKLGDRKRSLENARPHERQLGSHSPIQLKKEREKDPDHAKIVLPTFPLGVGERETCISGFLEEVFSFSYFSPSLRSELSISKAFRGKLWTIDSDNVKNCKDMEKFACLLIDTPSDRYQCQSS